MSVDEERSARSLHAPRSPGAAPGPRSPHSPHSPHGSDGSRSPGTVLVHRNPHQFVNFKPPPLAAQARVLVEQAEESKKRWRGGKSQDDGSEWLMDLSSWKERRRGRSQGHPSSNSGDEERPSDEAEPRRRRHNHEDRPSRHDARGLDDHQSRHDHRNHHDHREPRSGEDRHDHRHQRNGEDHHDHPEHRDREEEEDREESAQHHSHRHHHRREKGEEHEEDHEDDVFHPAPLSQPPLPQRPVATMMETPKGILVAPGPPRPDPHRFEAVPESPFKPLTVVTEATTTRTTTTTVTAENSATGTENTLFLKDTAITVASYGLSPEEEAGKMRRPRRLLYDETNQRAFEELDIVVEQRTKKPFGFHLSGGKDSYQPIQVESVSPDSAAERARLQVGDEIISVNGDPVHEKYISQVMVLVKESEKLGEIELHVKRYHQTGPGAASVPAQASKEFRSLGSASSLSSGSPVTPGASRASRTSMESRSEARAESPVAAPAFHDRLTRFQGAEKGEASPPPLASPAKPGVKLGARAEARAEARPDAEARPKAKASPVLRSPERREAEMDKWNSEFVYRRQPGRIEDFVPEVERDGGDVPDGAPRSRSVARSEPGPEPPAFVDQRWLKEMSKVEKKSGEKEPLMKEYLLTAAVASPTSPEAPPKSPHAAHVATLQVRVGGEKRVVEGQTAPSHPSPALSVTSTLSDYKSDLLSPGSNGSGEAQSSAEAGSLVEPSPFRHRDDDQSQTGAHVSAEEPGSEFLEAKLKRMASTRRIRQRIHSARTDFLGLKSPTVEESVVEDVDPEEYRRWDETRTAYRLALELISKAPEDFYFQGPQTFVYEVDRAPHRKKLLRPVPLPRRSVLVVPVRRHTIAAFESEPEPSHPAAGEEDHAKARETVLSFVKKAAEPPREVGAGSGQTVGPARDSSAVVLPTEATHFKPIQEGRGAGTEGRLLSSGAQVGPPPSAPGLPDPRGGLQDGGNGRGWATEVGSAAPAPMVKAEETAPYSHLRPGPLALSMEPLPWKRKPLPSTGLKTFHPFGLGKAPWASEAAPVDGGESLPPPEPSPGPAKDPGAEASEVHYINTGARPAAVMIAKSQPVRPATNGHNPNSPGPGLGQALLDDNHPPLSRQLRQERSPTLPAPARAPPGGASDHFQPHEPVVSVSAKRQCASCGMELGRGAAMLVESLDLFYHMECFRCSVCGASLGSGVEGTDVRVRGGKLHCPHCYSNDEAGLKFSEV